jgi:hypothetical protein
MGMDSMADRAACVSEGLANPTREPISMPFFEIRYLAE